jgi:hypothetical protein
VPNIEIIDIMPEESELNERINALIPDSERARILIAQAHERDLLSHSQEQDLYKHLATLSTGSIVLIVALLEKIFRQPTWRPLVGVALVSFMVSTVAALGMQLLSVLRVDADAKRSKRLVHPVLKIPVLLAGFGGFLAGVGALVAFALANF